MPKRHSFIPRPPEGETWAASCPQCDVSAVGGQEVLDKFGFRKSGDKYRVQSWCRACKARATPRRSRNPDEIEEETD